MASFLYSTMLALFITHELDVVKRHEWRVLPVTSFLPDATGAQVFIWIHAPLFAALFLFGANDPFSSAATGLSVFSILHIALHWFFRNHPAYEFNNAGSWI